VSPPAGAYQRRVATAFAVAAAEVASAGYAPTTAAVAAAMPGDVPAGSARVYATYAVRLGFVVRGERDVLGESSLYWPGPAAGEVLGADEVAAWEAARLLPPTEGTVRVGGHLYRVVDGEALGALPGSDWMLLRGGRAVSKDGATVGKWEVVHG
jgi:hypothetical protein